MSKEINYSSLTGAEKRKKALADMAGWLGKDKLVALKAEIATMPQEYAYLKGLEFQFAMFAGVSGYPVIALLAEAWDKTDEEILQMLDEGENANLAN